MPDDDDDDDEDEDDDDDDSDTLHYTLNTVLNRGESLAGEWTLTLANTGEGTIHLRDWSILAYAAGNADVAAAQVNPLQHYLEYGIYEDRSISALGVEMWA